MAGIKSLAVRGIRSFGPEECDEQRISFEKPLTLILGQNGCGKTTIIECLRYAITGQMPPGSRNECFVHDAKVNRSTEVMGQVKLKIVNAKDKQLEVSRSMRVTAYQNKKPKFQTLDSFLSVVDDNGKTKDISSRCADLDVVMHEEIGVPKAILNSVIFCHQEDASWPLDEGKKVKERFDEIFDADKYSDCFDRLRKIRKEYATNIKLLEQGVAHLTEKKEELDKKKLDLVNTETRISEAELKISELSHELKPLTEKINAIETLQKNLLAFESKRDKIKTRLEQNKNVEKDLKGSIQSIYEGSLKELQENIANYGATAKAKQAELEDSYKKNFSFNKEEERIANEKTSNEVKYNKLILLESQNQDKIDKRNVMIVETGKLAEIELDKIETNDEAVNGINAINKKIEELQNKLKEQKAASDLEEKEYQKHVDDCRDALSRHKQKISNKESEIQTTRKEIAKIQKQINEANKSKQKLEALDEKLKTAEADYEKAVSELNPEECQAEINRDEKLMEENENELEELSEKVTKLQKQSAQLKEKDIIEESFKQKDKQLNVLKNKHRTAITELLGHMPEKNFAIAINKIDCEIRNELESMNKKITEKQKEEEQNVLQSSMFIITKYKGQIKDNNCCPLCNRGFDNETEVTDLISQLTTQVLNVPAQLEKVTEELQKTSAKKDDLLSLRSLNDKITSLKETEIPELEKKLEDLDKVGSLKK
ncbi:unnamed protein product [Euphydryas editha]|uniref:Zinc-hook domain-containing protein n=1 Tax=Euphydryas editha TaxID=104508 RepID=A0AAU9UHK5_EUPED|nr:unnamed protein product [Euphydryas editha]